MAFVSTSHLLFFIAHLLFLSVHGLSDTETLLKFKESLVIGKANALESWNKSNPPCKWIGVLCHKGNIWGLRLENIELSGSLDIEALADLKHLRSLSFMNNKLKGPFPEFKKLGALKSIYLSNNQYDIKIPMDAFDGMGSLKKLHLEFNKFSGEIPTSIAKLPKLFELRLDGNQFTGHVPEFRQKLQVLNLSNNALSGPIPTSLSTMDRKSFEGNKELCGKPLETECSSNIKHSPAPTESPKKKSSTYLYIVAAVIGAILAILVVLGLIILICKRGRRNKKPQPSQEPGHLILEQKVGIKEGEKGQVHAKKVIQPTKLTFLRDDKGKFELQDLLKASAEILGSGCFGGSYKTVLLDGTMMVVKRFKHMNNVGIEEFQEHMKRLGRLKHDNILPIVAYYYKKEEKLFVCEFVQKRSLAAHLHGHKSLGQPSLDWPTRLKIVKGVGRGLLYLQKNLPSQMAPHGHLKSSNVLLTEKLEPLLTDYGLIPLINEERAQELMMAYKSPEYLTQSRITKKTDVWELGLLILEILTGKFPDSFPRGTNKSEDIASWVNSIFQDEWVEELFDQEMGKNKNYEVEILKLLKIGLSCCQVDVEKRLDIREAVKKIEELTDDLEGDAASEADGKSLRGV